MRHTTLSRRQPTAGVHLVVAFGLLTSGAAAGTDCSGNCAYVYSVGLYQMPRLQCSAAGAAVGVNSRD